MAAEEYFLQDQYKISYLDIELKKARFEVTWPGGSTIVSYAKEELEDIEEDIHGRLKEIGYKIGAIKGSPKPGEPMEQLAELAPFSGDRNRERADILFSKYLIANKAIWALMGVKL
jgi:hypothetical protein